MSYQKLLTDLATLESPRTKPYAPWRDPELSESEFRLSFMERQSVYDQERICRFYGLGRRRAESLSEMAKGIPHGNTLVAWKYLDSARRKLRRAIDRYMEKLHGPAPVPEQTDELLAFLDDLRADMDRFSARLDQFAAKLKVLPPLDADAQG